MTMKGGAGWLALALASAIGCNPGVYKLQDPACETDVDDWYPHGELGNLLAADGEGQFDRSFDHEAVSRITGTWDPETGDYEARLTFPSDHRFTGRWIFGTVQPQPSGDYEADLTSVTRDIHDGLSASVYRYQRSRQGCITTQVYDETGAEELTTTETLGVGSLDLVVHRVDTNGLTLSRSRTLEADGGVSGDGHLTHPSGAARDEWVTGSWADDHLVTEYQEADAQSLVEGRSETWANGDRHESGSHSTPEGELLWTWDYVVDFFGNGGGTVEYSDGVECELVYDHGARTCHCPDGRSTSC